MTTTPGLDLIGAYSHKVKALDELCGLLGTIYRPHRKRSVVLCHGVFDIVHPGHIRHLIYAKSKADVLVASITADMFIDKALYRPFVPQTLRALNLAALEMVDYVLVDTEKTPLSTIKRLQPDFFAKGYEYQSNGLSPATQQEIDAVKDYGGEMLFTPGDVVFSSSALIESGPPDLKFDKLRLLMEDAGLTFDSLKHLIDQFSRLRVHVVGDTIVDTLTYTTQLGGISKTPTPSVQYEREEHFIGGAAIVALHLAGAGADVVFTTVLGDDAMGNFVLEEMPGRITIHECIDRTRPTTHKNAFVCNGYRLLKVDTVDNRQIDETTLTHFRDSLQRVKADAVVFSDFRHGIFNRHTIPLLTAAIPSKARRIADSQVASRWGNILDFKGFNLITPNEREARFALADQDSGVMPLIERLYQETGCDVAIMKLAEHGSVVCTSTGPVRQLSSLDSFAGRVLDSVGAGDAFLAYASLALTWGGGAIAAVILGTVAAALECEVNGNVPVSAEDVLKRLGEIER